MQNNINPIVRNLSTRGRAKKSFFSPRRLLPKILCVFAAFVIWLYVMQTETPEYESVITSVTVELQNASQLRLESGLAVYSRTTNIVDVKLTGKKSVIDRLDADDITAFIDLSNIKTPGQHALDVFVELPDGIDKILPEPAAISVYVDENDVISLKVSERLTNLSLDDNYELGEIDFEYDSITVTGPKNKLAELTEAQVLINMQGKTSSFVADCPVSLIGRAGEAADMSYLSTSVDEMSVSVPILMTREVPLETVFKYGLLNSDLAEVSIYPESITVKGDESVITSNSVIFEPLVIDEKQILDNTYTISLLPVTTADVSYDRDTQVEISVKLDPSLKTKKFNVTDIEVTGATDELVWQVLDSSEVVTLRGTSKNLSSIKASDITLVVDLSGYDNETSGIISKTATVVIDDKNAAEIYEIGYCTVQIKLN